MSNGSVKICDPDQVTVVIANILIEGGYADGEFLAWQKTQDSFLAVEGTDGEVSRSKTNSKLTRVTLNLMQTSSSNVLLSALHNIDLATPGGGGIGAFLVKDRGGNSLYEGSKCWIVRTPDVSWDKTAKPRAWMIDVADLNSLEGGN